MGTASRTNSTSRSRSPWEQRVTSSQNIPERSRSQRNAMATPRRDASHSSHTAASHYSQSSQASHSSHTTASQHQITDLMSQPSQGNEEGAQGRQTLCIQDLRAIAADIKDTLSAAISELRVDILSLTDRVQQVRGSISPP